MAINFSNGAQIEQRNNRIYVPGKVVQMVNTVNATALQNATTTPRDYFTSNPITMINASNYLLIEWHVDVRTNDWGDGIWNLCYMDLIHVQSGTQFTYTGFEGEYTLNIKHLHRTARHQPGTVGPHSYKLRGWSYSARNTSFNGTDGWVGNDNQSWIRITEIAV
jgi:hypothetical protein